MGLYFYILTIIESEYNVKLWGILNNIDEKIRTEVIRMVPALFVANYIIEYSNNMGDEMNNLKLQKLLYFINARFLVEENRSLFEENFEKWKFGPVIPSVYHEYKSCGAFGISSEKYSARIL